LISGTSVDGVDGAIVHLTGQGYDLHWQVIGGQTLPYLSSLRQQLLDLCAGVPISLAELAALDDAIAEQFAQAAQQLITQYGAVDLIGSHGQTVFHRPCGWDQSSGQRSLAYSLQLGRGAAIVQLTRCQTVSNFRQADIAVGGEGAPLVPPVDLALLTHPSRWRCIQNIGGIGNVTVLPPWDKTTSPPKVLGWDTGPGNSLIDLAVEHLTQGQQTYDKDGKWAASGNPHIPLVEAWLEHPYFHQLPPKSTGRELFGQAFLETCLAQCETLSLNTADILASLTELTVQSIVHSYRQYLPHLPDEILVCGGGSYNSYLLTRLQYHLPQILIGTTANYGVPVGLKEAIAFAVLAYWRHQNFPSNLPAVTGANHAALLGEVFRPFDP
jgi:anhydro-N-acetylmuramic acid kinase